MNALEQLPPQDEAATLAALDLIAMQQRVEKRAADEPAGLEGAQPNTPANFHSHLDELAALSTHDEPLRPTLEEWQRIKQVEAVLRNLATSIDAVKADIFAVERHADLPDEVKQLCLASLQQQLAQLETKQAQIEGELVIDGRKLKWQRGTSIQVKPVDWLWHGWIPRNSLTAIFGLPKSGKSTIVWSLLASALGHKAQWPDGTATQKPAGPALVFAPEDDKASVTIPRMLAAGVNVNDVIFGEATQLKDVLGQVQAAAQRNDAPSVIVIDPVLDLLQGKTIDMKDMSVALQALLSLAEHFKVAIIAVCHTNKRTDADSQQDRAMGSRAFTSKPRALIWTGEYRNDSHFRVAAVEGSSIVPKGFTYRLQQATVQGIETSKVEWCMQVEGSSDDLIATRHTREQKRKLDAAEQWLTTMLRDNPMSAKDLKDQAEDEGYSVRTLQRARTKLGVVVTKNGKESIWKLP